MGLVKPTGRNLRPLPTRPHEHAADRLHSAAVRLLRRLRQYDAELDLGPAQVSVLSVLVFSGPKSLKELATLEQVTPATMSRVVTSLERLGMIEREPAAHDRRVLRIAPTPTGRSLLNRGRARRVTALATLLDALSSTDLACLERASSIIDRVLTRPR